MLLHKLKYIAGALLLLALLATGAGLALRAAQPDEPEGRDSPPANAAPGPRQQARTRTAFQVAEAYQFNDANGDEHFTGKRLRVTGQWDWVTRKQGRVGPVYVLTMPGADVDKGIGTGLLLAFEFGADSRKRLASLQPMQIVTVEGRCEGRCEGRLGGEERGLLGLGGTVVFRDCKLVAVEPARRPPAGFTPPGVLPTMPGRHGPPGVRGLPAGPALPILPKN